MKWIIFVIMVGFLAIPTMSQATVATAGTVVNVEAPASQPTTKKGLKRWIRNHPGILIFGGVALGGILMIIFGVIRGIRWLWLLGIFVIVSPWLLAGLALLLMLIFGGRRRPHPQSMPEDSIQKKPDPKKDK